MTRREIRTLVTSLRAAAATHTSSTDPYARGMAAGLLVAAQDIERAAAAKPKRRARHRKGPTMDNEVRP